MDKSNLLTILTFLIVGVFFVKAVHSDTDMYWHLSLGRLVWETHKIPTIDPFVYGSDSANFVSVEWLAGLIYYVLVKSFGMDVVVVVLRVLVGVITIFTLYLTTNLLTKNTLLGLNLVLVVSYILSFRLYDRPEIFSFLFISVINYLGCYFYSKGKVHILSVLLPLIFLAWPNIHGFAIVGIGMLMFYCVIFLVKADFKPSRQLYILFAVSALLSVLQLPKFFYFVWHITTPPPVGEFLTIPARLFSSKGIDFLNQISWHIYLYFFFLLTSIAVFVGLVRNIKRTRVEILVSLFVIVLLLSPLKLSRLIGPIILITSPLIILLLEK